RAEVAASTTGMESKAAKQLPLRDNPRYTHAIYLEYRYFSLTTRRCFRVSSRHACFRCAAAYRELGPSQQSWHGRSQSLGGEPGAVGSADFVAERKPPVSKQDEEWRGARETAGGRAREGAGVEDSRHRSFRNGMASCH